MSSSNLTGRATDLTGIDTTGYGTTGTADTGYGAATYGNTDVSGYRGSNADTYGGARRTAGYDTGYDTGNAYNITGITTGIRGYRNTDISNAASRAAQYDRNNTG